MYFKIKPIFADKYQSMGMLNITAEFYLEPGDEGYDVYHAEHHVPAPVMPVGGYPGDKNENGQPIDHEEYASWVKTLPTVEQINPFCNHSIQFESGASAEEILWCFEWALALTHINYLKQDLCCRKKNKDGTPMGKPVNQPFEYSHRRAFFHCVSKIPEQDRTQEMKKEMGKVIAAQNRISQMQDVDWAMAKTIVKYKVRN